MYLPRHLSIVLAAALLTGDAAAGEAAGPPIGARIESFQVKDCTGPATGKTLCYACRYAGRPVAAVFVRQLSPDVMRLIQRLDDDVARHRGRRLAAFVVLLAEDTSPTEQRLRQLAREHRIRRTPLTIYRDSPARLRAPYRVSPEAAATVLLWRDWEVQAGRVFRTAQLSETDIGRVADDLARMLEPSE